MDIKQLVLLAHKKALILKLLLGRKSTKHIRYYKREYLYVVSGREYTLNTVETNSKPYKTIKYNPSNPNEAETYEGVNTETIVIFFIALIGIFSPFIVKIVKNHKTNTIKRKLFILSKRNIIKILTVFLIGYLGLSLILSLKNLFLTPNWSQIVIQYSRLEIFIECFIYIINRFGFKKLTSHFNIFRIYIWY